jgi:hypothetical protein
MPCNRLPRLIKKLLPKRQKEPRRTSEEISGYVRLLMGQQVAQLLDSYMMMMMMMMNGTISI